MSTIQAWSRVAFAVAVMVSSASGQTADDPGEGLRIETTGTSNVRAVKWWGRTGRTYFVQSNPTLNPNTWSYMPVVESGTSAVHSWNLSTTGQRMFVRLVYTDQLFSGSASLADFDGDGLTNAQEVASSGPRSNPLISDTDDDGFSDSVEWGGGYSPVNGYSNPDYNGGSYKLRANRTYLSARHVVSQPVLGVQTFTLRKSYSNIPGFTSQPVQSYPERPELPALPAVPNFYAVSFNGWSIFDPYSDNPLASGYHHDLEYNVVEEAEYDYTWAQLRLEANFASTRPRIAWIRLNGTGAGGGGQQYITAVLPPGVTQTSDFAVQTAQVVSSSAEISVSAAGVQPIEIKRDIAGGEVRWEPLTGRAAKALPGQKISLKLELPPGITASDYHWSSSNWFKDYPEPTHNRGEKVPFEASDLTGEQMHYYWSGTGIKTVTVNCLINGERVFIQRNIDVVKPACTFDANQDPTVVGPGWPYRGKCSFNAEVDKLPATFSEGGKWMFLQMVSTALLITPTAGPPNKCNEYDGEWCLDTRAEWAPTVNCAGTSKVSDGTPQSFSDNPNGGANETIGTEQYDDDFRTYVMFKSNEPEARWVPLKVIEWDMGFTSAVTGSFGSEEQQYTSSYPQASRTLTGAETTLHPEWSHITSFLIVPKP